MATNALDRVFRKKTTYILNDIIHRKQTKQNAILITKQNIKNKHQLKVNISISTAQNKKASHNSMHAGITVANKKKNYQRIFLQEKSEYATFRKLDTWSILYIEQDPTCCNQLVTPLRGKTQYRISILLGIWKTVSTQANKC